MEKRSGGVMVVRISFVSLISALLLFGYLFANWFWDTDFFIQNLAIFFFTTWIFIAIFIVFEKLLHI
ncbi:MAG: hypothetical protein ACFFAS_13420 [Promethearchaeota archaeon]